MDIGLLDVDYSLLDSSLSVGDMLLASEGCHSPSPSWLDASTPALSPSNNPNIEMPLISETKTLDQNSSLSYWSPLFVPSDEYLEPIHSAGRGEELPADTVGRRHFVEIEEVLPDNAHVQTEDSSLQRPLNLENRLRALLQSEGASKRPRNDCPPRSANPSAETDNGDKVQVDTARLRGGNKAGVAVNLDQAIGKKRKVSLRNTMPSLLAQEVGSNVTFLSEFGNVRKRAAGHAVETSQERVGIPSREDDTSPEIRRSLGSASAVSESLLNGRAEPSRREERKTAGTIQDCGTPDVVDTAVLESMTPIDAAELLPCINLTLNHELVPTTTKKRYRSSNFESVPCATVSPTRNLQLDSYHNMLHARLLALAEALATADEDRSRELLTHVNEVASPEGDSMERIAYYALKALHLRSLGKGTLHTISLPVVTYEEQDVMIQHFARRLPYIAVIMATSICMILDAMKGQSKVHIVDFLFPPIVLERLLMEIARRPEGPPQQLRITFVDSIGVSGPNFACKEVRKRLAKFAASMGIPFWWSSVRTKLTDFNTCMVKLFPDEAVAVHVGTMLQHLPDESVMRSNPRDKFLRMLHDLNPRVVCVTDNDCDLNIPFFMKRLKNSLTYFRNMFDAVQVAYHDDFDNRQIFEERILADEFINTIATEGLDLWFRTECIERLQLRMKRVGFTVRPIQGAVLESIEALVGGQLVPGFTLESKLGALLMKWKGFSSAFTCAFRQAF